MEVLYKKLYGFRNTVIEYWVIYLVSVVMNYLGEREVISGEQTFWQKMTDLNNSAVFILLLLTVAMVAYYLLLMVTGYYARKQEPVAAFTRIMKEHSIEQAHAKIAGGLVWGQDRTLWTAPNIVLGVEPQNVRVTHYEPVPFAFLEDEHKKGLNELVNTKKFKETQALGNALPRYMLTRYGGNFNKERPVLWLQLRETSWGQCQYVWHRYDYEYKKEEEDVAKEKQKEWREQIIIEHMNSGLRVANYPNSLCLHLIIETSDGKVLITEISQEKKNDYPRTKAVSIGEQIELADFIDQKDFQEDFVTEWTRRAVCEEFGLSEQQYERAFDEKSLRVLSLDFEMDIYNFALVCTMKMRHDCEEFKKLVSSTIEQKEISDMQDMHVEDIPVVLMGYPENEKEYHPSSYLRLLMFYLYKNGYKRTCKVFKKM